MAWYVCLESVCWPQRSEACFQLVAKKPDADLALRTSFGGELWTFAAPRGWNNAPRCVGGP